MLVHYFRDIAITENGNVLISNFALFNLSHDHVLITINIFSIKGNNVRPVRKSATSPVLQGRFQCHKKQLARNNVIDQK